ncbi:MAG: aldolase/citrate lyase family protein [Desulfovibrionaceae bacterium]
MLSFLFFTKDPAQVRLAAAAGIERVVVDIERRGKMARQGGYHLEINEDAIADLDPLRDAPIARFLRVNALYEGTADEVREGLARGADGFILPMVRGVDDTRRFADLVDGRACVIALVETLAGLAALRDIAARGGVDEVYVGLNDLSLETGRAFAYQLLAEGMLDKALAGCRIPFGFGGATVVDGGHPLPSRSILAELARLGATRVILRRAFKRDVAGRSWPDEIAAIRDCYEACRRRSAAAACRDRDAVWRDITRISREMESVKQ